MTKIFKYLIAYLMWILDLGLSFWLFLIEQDCFAWHICPVVQKEH